MAGRYVALMAFALVLVGCGATTGATDGQLVRRAAFDLNCSAREITLVTIDEQTEGVTGCGQRATYVQRCSHDAYGGDQECTWVLNTDFRHKDRSAE